ncbi:RPC1, partial [Symbiodinium sp. CCMP2456]
GIPSTKRSVLNKKEVGDKVSYTLLVEGYGLREVMGTPGINPNKTSSNHVVEVEKVLGIEAARRTIMQEIKVTLGAHGISVDATFPETAVQFAVEPPCHCEVGHLPWA